MVPLAGSSEDLYSDGRLGADLAVLWEAWECPGQSPEVALVLGGSGEGLGLGNEEQDHPWIQGSLEVAIQYDCGLGTSCFQSPCLPEPTLHYPETVQMGEKCYCRNWA